MGQRVLVVLGHPASDRFSGAHADTYAQAATAAGHEVRWLRLGDLQFDPVLHAGYRSVQPLEPDLLAAQAAIIWAQHTVWVFPVWWGGVPSLLKGFLDRIFLPGFAYKFHPGKAFAEKLLKGRTAHLLVPMDTPPWYFRWVYRMPAIHQMRKTTLDFCGIRPTRTLMLGPVIHSKPGQRQAWLEKARAMGAGIG